MRIHYAPLIAALSLLSVSCAAAGPSRPARPWHDAAIETAHWLERVGIEADAGQAMAWEAVPGDPKTASPNLYDGTAGVVLFFLELYQSSGEEKYLQIASRGANSLLASIPAKLNANNSGLYTGAAGIAFALAEVTRAGGDQKYHNAAIQIINMYAGDAGAPTEMTSVNDIIAGRAGIGLFMIYAHKRLRHPRALEIAERAGRDLLACAHRDGNRWWWSLDSEYKRNLPNFSHGTAGIAYFLGKLYEVTGEKEYLHAAIAGAEYLVSIANQENGGFLVFHADPDGRDRYYLGYCHGPAGTARLFHLLFNITKNEDWAAVASRCAESIHSSGIPAARTSGYWNNVSQCCGAAGIASYLLYYYECAERISAFHPMENTGHDSLALARAFTEDLLNRAERDERGLRFPQAEHRAKPEWIVAQTGYAQGAAGIGLWLLHLDDYERGQTPRIVLPDAPGAWR